VLTAAVAATPTAAVAQDTPPAVPTPATPASPTSRPAAAGANVGITVPQLLAALTAPATPAPARLEAARRLVARQSNDARAAIRQVHPAADNSTARLAAVRALADDPNPSPDVLDDLLPMLSDERTSDAAAQAIGTYKSDPRALDALSRAVADTRRAPALRLPAIRALGQIVEPAAAAALAKLVTSPSESGDVVAAAEDALVELTGIESNGRDPAKWNQWQQANASRPALEWKQDMLRSRSARDARLRRRADETATELQRILEESYRDAPNKPERLLRFLDADSAEVRRAGVRIADQVATLTPLQNTQEVKDRLVQLIGDADPGVRLAVLKALDDINIDADQALAAILPQLQVEPDATVRAAIARKLGGVASVNQIAPLSALLDDPSPAVVQEAAEAIRRRAPQIIERDPKLAQATVQRLRQVMRNLANRPGFLDARRKVGEAVAAFHDKQNVAFAQELLNPREPAAIRGVGFLILGESGLDVSNFIENAVDDEPDPVARVQGVRALARTKRLDHAQWLIDKMDPGKERSADVRAAARQGYIDLLASAPTPWLSTEASRRWRNNPAMRIEVLKELVRKLHDAREDEAAAMEEQNLGIEYLNNLQPPQPREAALHLRPAFDYWRKRGTSPDVTDRLVTQLATAMLRDRQYTQLTQLVQDVVKTSTPADARAYQDGFGRQIRLEADRLVNAPVNSRNLDDASALIDAALKMDPPISGIYREDLQRFADQIEYSRRQGVGRKTPASR
jgi:HEAT repeat protein